MGNQRPIMSPPVRVKRWGKSPPLAAQACEARKTPSGARPNRGSRARPAPRSVKAEQIPGKAAQINEPLLRREAEQTEFGLQPFQSSIQAQPSPLARTVAPAPSGDPPDGTDGCLTYRKTVFQTRAQRDLPLSWHSPRLGLKTGEVQASPALDCKERVSTAGERSGQSEVWCRRRGSNPHTLTGTRF